MASMNPILVRSSVALVVAATLTGSACNKKPASHDTSGESGARSLRVVSLTPSSTELVAAAGGLSLLVGVDKFSVYPPEVAELPRVGGFLDPSFEAILSLEPDLVVLDSVQVKAAEGLSSAGIRTLMLEMHTTADVRVGLTRVGAAIDEVAAAAAAVATMDRALSQVAERTRARSEQAAPLLLALVEREVGSLRGMVAAGPGSYLDELLALVGAGNVMAGSGLRYSTISTEQILRGQPDVILECFPSADSARARADWGVLSSVPAVSRGRVHALADRVYLSPTPRVGHALRGLEQVIYGSD